MEDKQQNTVIIIVGPTASGKTDLSLQLAERFQTSIISADSRQCYKELHIGVAKPDTEQLQRVRHYFIDSHSIHDNVTAQTFETYALRCAEEIFTSNQTVVMAGGTGLYIKAFCEGLDLMPATNTEIRHRIAEQYRIKGLEWLQQEVRQKDPAFWEVAEKQNPQRLMRALEIFETTGRSVTEFRNSQPRERPFKVIKIGLDIDKPRLYNNINERVDRMIAEGLVEEVRSLLPYRELNALQTVGYRELFDYLQDKCTLSEAVEKIKQNTRQYAKRQMTWFKKDKSICWFHAADIPPIVSLLSKSFGKEKGVQE